MIMLTFGVFNRNIIGRNSAHYSIIYRIRKIYLIVKPSPLNSDDRHSESKYQTKTSNHSMTVAQKKQ